MNNLKKENQKKEQQVKARKSNLELLLSNKAGVPVEITVRGDKSFTFSFDGRNDSALSKIENFFKSGGAKTSTLYDAETDYSLVYVELN